MSNGICGVIANDSARYSLFSSCIDQLHLPPGWKKEWVIGGDWCDARNQLCQLVLDEGYSHLWFMDDDHAFPPEILVKLLAHDVPLVTPVCLTRVYPFNPVQYVAGENGSRTLPIPLSQVATEGLIEIEAGGCAGMLIRRDVLEGIVADDRSLPFFEYSDQSEDVIFCGKAKTAGFPIYTDLSVRLGHITTAVVWPAVKDGQWTTGLNVGRDLALTVDTFEGFLEKEKHPLWAWKLTPETKQDMVIVTLHRQPDEPVGWQPEIGRVPKGVLQWWVDMRDGEGFKPVGDPFIYELKGV